MTGNFDAFIEKVLEEHGQFRIRNMRCAIPLPLDDDYDNSRQRLLVYEKKRDILMNLARPDPAITENESQKFPVTIISGSRASKRWDMSINLFSEKTPDEIIKAVGFSRKFQRQNALHLPHLVSIDRNVAVYQVVTSCLPIKLRDIIHNRAQMELRATKLIELLLMGFLELCFFKVSMRTIQPCSVFVSRDFQSLVFSDIS